ncbi:MAG: thiamine pyrophosphate-binding protein [Bacteroidales bacterium]
MKVPGFLAEKLEENGVKYVYGIPGGPSIPYMEAIRESGMEFILVSHESAAAVMADVTARLTGTTGVCHGTFGPGAVNLASGTGTAFLDRSPVLALTSELPDTMLNRTSQMNIDHQALFTPLTLKTHRLTAEKAGQMIEAALEQANSEYPGPVHLGLPTDLAVKDIGFADPVTAKENELTFRNDTGRIAAMLSKCRKPLLAVGLTAQRFGLKRKLSGFLADYPMPVVLTPMAKGLVPEDHPCYAGVLFHSLSDYLQDITGNCDLVIGFGYDQVEFNYETWMPDVPLIQFNTIPTDLPGGDDRLQYAGPPSEWLDVLKNLNNNAISFEKNAIATVRDEMNSVFNGFLSHFGPVKVLSGLMENLPSETIVTSDVGSHLHLIGQYWKTPLPGRLIMTNGWSSMGFGIPAANAVSLNRPGTPVVCITGDGGFLMSAGEIMTARRYNLPVLFVVLSDGELNLIRLKQSWKDLGPYGTSLYHGSLFGANNFLGVKVYTVESATLLKASIHEALALKEPVIINAVIDPEDYKWLVVRR